MVLGVECREGDVWYGVAVESWWRDHDSGWGRDAVGVDVGAVRV